MSFEKRSLKGIFGKNMSYPPKWSLTDDSRFAILKAKTFARMESLGLNLA